MTAPIVTDYTNWLADKFRASVLEVAEITGQPIDPERVEQYMREAAQSRWSQADDIEGDWPGWARAGSDRIADRWTEPQP